MLLYFTAFALMGHNLRYYRFWSALATAPAETSAEAKEASIIALIFFFSFFLH